MSEFSESVVAKAATLEVTEDEIPFVLHVKGSERTYLVHLIRHEGSIAFATCSCPHGLRKGGGHARCSHVAAALMHVGHLESH